MTIETLEVTGFKTAFHAMRNPMDSWAKADSLIEYGASGTYFKTGPADKDLSVRLQNAGPEHAKHLRMIHASADIKAARYFWQEMDTYRAGVEKISCSTMHKLMSRPLTLEDFEYQTEGAEIALQSIINSINGRMENYKALMKDNCMLEAKEIWREIIQILPQSYLQKRTVQFSYAALRNIIKQREGHKLVEWKYFIDWCRSLPESWMLFDDA